jgi:hypothetical protein
VTSGYLRRAASAAVEPQDAYDLYLEAFEQEARREFEEGGNEYADFATFLAEDPPMSWSEFFTKWTSEQKDLARELRWRSA